MSETQHETSTVISGIYISINTNTNSKAFRWKIANDFFLIA